jgi:hypothetical protein
MAKGSNTNLQLKPKNIIFILILVLVGIILASIIGIKIFEPDLSTISFLKEEKVTPIAEKQPKIIASPQENWTEIAPPPFKMQSPKILVEKEKKILGRDPIFVKGGSAKESIPQILTAYEKGLEKRGISQTGAIPPTSTKPKWKDWELSPILVLYGNWEENPSIFPQTTNVGKPKKEVLEVLPANDTARKTPIQSLQEVTLIYTVPNDWRGRTIIVRIQCQEFNIDLPIGADPMTQPNNTKEHSQAMTSRNPESPTSQFIGPKIRARLINGAKKLDRWKESFITEIPKELKWIKERLNINQDTEYLELRIQTTRGVGIKLNPTLKVRVREKKVAD